MAKAKSNPERDLLLTMAKMVALMARHGNPKEMRDELDKAIAAVEGGKDADD
jgi:hypothetical protein